MFAADPPIRAVGRYAFVRVLDGQLASLGICDGSRLVYEEVSLPIPPGVSGEVLSVRNQETGDAEHALVVSERLPTRPGRPGERVIVRFRDGMTYGLAVREIRQEGDVSVIALHHRPGFRVSADGLQTELTHWPARLSQGRPAFYLPGTAYQVFGEATTATR
jgi:hypothetical protein